MIIGKEFSVYEAYIEDKCRKRVFIHTMIPPSEDNLGKELMWPTPDYTEPIRIGLEADPDGCFTDLMIIDGQSNSIDNWKRESE